MLFLFHHSKQECLRGMIFSSMYCLASILASTLPPLLDSDSATRASDPVEAVDTGTTGGTGDVNADTEDISWTIQSTPC